MLLEQLVDGQRKLVDGQREVVDGQRELQRTFQEARASGTRQASKISHEDMLEVMASIKCLVDWEKDDPSPEDLIMPRSNEQQNTPWWVLFPAHALCVPTMVHGSLAAVLQGRGCGTSAEGVVCCRAAAAHPKAQGPWSFCAA